MDLNKPKKRDDRRVRWTLLDNGIDFVRSGVEFFYNFKYEKSEYGSDSSFHISTTTDLEQILDHRPDQSYKYAILHLHAGCLLLFKEKLRREHECLIYDKIDAQRGGRTHTVNFEQSVARLERWASFNLNPKDAIILKKLKSIRNSTEHFELEISKDEVTSVVALVVDFLVKFLREELEVRIETKISTNSWSKIRELKETAQTLEMEEISKWNMRQQEFLDKSESEFEELAQSIKTVCTNHNKSASDFETCLSCGKLSLKLLDYDTYLCTSPDCRQITEAYQCIRCECKTTELEQLGLCSSCAAYLEIQ